MSEYSVFFMSVIIASGDPFFYTWSLYNFYLLFCCRLSKSNSIWAFASSGIRCGGQQRLMQCVAETLDRNRGEIVKDFKPQELSNTVSYNCEIFREAFR